MVIPTRAKRRRSREAAVLIWLVVALAGIFGVVALSLDAGRVMDERRRAQATADAAALAAAIELYEQYGAGMGYDANGNANKAALDLAAANGFTDDGVNTIVTVNIPPKSGEFASRAEFAEVVIQSNLPGGFAAALSHSQLVVKARAVARGRPREVGMVILDPSKSGALTNRSQAVFTLLFGSMQVNSDSPSAFSQDSSGVIVADEFDIVGGFVNSGGGTILGAIATGAAPSLDPLRRIPPPDPSAHPVRSEKALDLNLPAPTILQPGIYRGGIKIRGLAVVTLLPGTYILDGGGLSVSNLATVLGVGVTIYNTSITRPAGPIQIGGLGKLDIVAPLTGPLRGIGIFQDRTQTTPISITGNGTTTLIGAVYARSAHVDLTGDAAIGVDILGGAYVVKTLTIGGVGAVNVDLGFNRPAVPEINLVE